MMLENIIPEYLNIIFAIEKCFDDKYCSRECYMAVFNPKNISGERFGPEYRTWRLAVLKKDGFKCVKCGCTTGLQAHHIYSWKYYLDQRFNIDNGLTVCTECHKEIHNRFGWDSQEFMIYAKNAAMLRLKRRINMDTLSKVGRLIDDFRQRVGLLPNVLVVNDLGMMELVKYSDGFGFNAHREEEITLFLGLKVELDVNSSAPFGVKYVTRRAES